MNNVLIISVVAILMIGLISMIHYRGLAVISRIPINQFARPNLPLLIVPSLALLHLTEIVLYAALYYVFEHYLKLGSLQLIEQANLSDYFYHSISCFTTLGLADFDPDELFRILSGTEALAGFMMITWSASFLYAAFAGFWKAE